MGTCIWPQNLSRILIKELVQGRDMTTQLQNLLHKPLGEHGSVSTEELAEKISNSFTKTLSVLMGNNNNNNGVINSNISDQFSGAGAGGDQGSQVNVEASHDVEHSHCDDRNSEDSGESKKRSSSALKDRRGCYKRRKNSQSWTTVSDTLDDGLAWRKYGQKEILNAKYPRAYFRCTRKYDQGCRATRQVQQIEDNPKRYQTTYIGEHTCKNILKAPQMFKDSDTWESVNTKVSSDNPRIPNTSKSTAIRFVEQEIKEETPRSDSLSDNLSLDPQNLWPHEFKDLELSDPSMGLLSQKMIGYSCHNDQEDVSMITFSLGDQTCSTSTTSHSLDIEDDFVVKSIDFRNCDFEFDEIEFPLGSV